MSRSAIQGYIGIAKQAVKGTAVPPTLFVKATGKPTTSPVINLEAQQEGPGRDVTLVTKQSQTFDGSFGFLARPRTAGLLIAAALGKDRLVGVPVGGGGSSTLNGAVVAGATTVTVVSATNIAVNDIIQIDINDDATGKIAECVKVTNVAGMVLTITPALEFGHATGVAVVEVSGPFTHTVTPATDYNLPWYTVETMVADFIQRIKDVRVDGFRLSGKAGSPIELSVDYVGLTGAAQAAATAETYETDAPVMFHGGVFTVDATPITNISDVSIDFKNNLSRDDFTSDVVRADTTPGRRELDVSFTLTPDAATAIKALYYGVADAPGKAPVTGSLALDFTYGAGAAAREIKVEVPALYYVAEPLEQDPSGGKLTTAVKALGAKPNGSDLITVTIKTDSYLRL